MLEYHPVTLMIVLAVGIAGWIIGSILGLRRAKAWQVDNPDKKSYTWWYAFRIHT